MQVEEGSIYEYVGKENLLGSMKVLGYLTFSSQYS